ncbi:MAG: DUF418 domain-containing protein [Actinomycetales bacterium]|nr:DUF418 domain-containing protein [Actinomycetales bacterium]
MAIDSPQRQVQDGATGPAAPAPVSRGERSLAPDIARGLLLVFIAVANIPSWHVGNEIDESAASGLDRVVAAVEAMFVVDRSRPMFAVLFGFGLAVMASRMAARGIDLKGIRRVLRRRSRWLILIGLVHATLLWPGDILAPYGATALVALMLVNRSDRVLRRWFWVSVVLGSLAYFVVLLASAEDPTAERGAPSYVGFMVEGLTVSVVLQLASLVFLVFLPLVITGFWMFRAGWLTRPQDHLPGLRRVFWTCMAVNVAVSVPAALQALEVLRLDGMGDTALRAFEMQAGAVAGVGYVCGFALLAARWESRGRTGLPGVLAAVGERSMTAYLCQSLLFFPLVTEFGLGLGRHLGTAGDAVVAIAVWGVIAVGMAALSRLGLRGPFEVLMRRLTYRGLTGRAGVTSRRARARGGGIVTARPLGT